MAGTIAYAWGRELLVGCVSMESGLDGRNNPVAAAQLTAAGIVSMESGLDGRNNLARVTGMSRMTIRLNGVRPRWPEQWGVYLVKGSLEFLVSMESGLDGRNNAPHKGSNCPGVRQVSMESGLDGRNNGVVRELLAPPSRVSMESGLDGRNNSEPGRGAARPIRSTSQWSPA